MRRFVNYLVILLVGAAVIMGLGFFIVHSREAEMKRLAAEELMESVESLGAVVIPEHSDRLSGSEKDLSVHDYDILRSQFIVLGKIFKEEGVKGLYSMKLTDNGIAFMIDSAALDDPWHSEPGVIYTNPPPALLEIFHSGGKRFIGPYTDEYGTYYSAFIPFYDANGAISGVLGADIELEAYNFLITQQQRLPILYTLLALFFYFAIFIIYRNRSMLMAGIKSRDETLKEKNRQLAIEKLASDDQRKRLQVLIERLPVGVMIYSMREKQEVSYNHRAKEMFGGGLSRGPISERFLNSLKIFDDENALYPIEELPLAIALRTRKTATASGLLVNSKNHEKIALRMTSVPILNSRNAVSSIVTVFEDLTAEYEIDKRKSEFIFVASHELRAPLAAMKWSIEMLQDKGLGKVSKDQQSLIDQLDATNSHLIKIVNDLLNVSRLELGTLAISPVPLDLTSVIEESVDEIQPLLKKNHVSLSFKRAKYPLVLADSEMVRHIFSNLLSNAAKYTKENGRIELAVESKLDEVLITIKDNGVGIPEKQKKYIFTKFFRAENILQSKIEGTGLGLYVCKGMVERLHGKIGFASKENSGSTFWFTLPIAKK